MNQEKLKALEKMSIGERLYFGGTEWEIVAKGNRSCEMEEVGGDRKMELNHSTVVEAIAVTV